MSRPPLMAHPVRLHISLEEETMRKLRRLAKQKSKNVTEMIRGLAKAYADGAITLREEPLSDVVARIHAFRERHPYTPQRSENIVRAMRDKR